VNRWSKQIDLDLRQVEKFLNEPVVGFVPSDYQQAVSSINLGTPLVQAEPTSKIAMEIRRIAQQMSLGVAPIEQTSQRRGFLSSLLKKQQPAQRLSNLQTSMEKV
jgi:Flp pilus assembly CpaE family ATPase